MGSGRPFQVSEIPIDPRLGIILIKSFGVRFDRL